MSPSTVWMVFQVGLLLAGAAAWIVVFARREAGEWLAPKLRFPAWEAPLNEIILFALLTLGLVFGMSFLVGAALPITPETAPDPRMLIILGFAQHLGALAAVFMIRALPHGRPPRASEISTARAALDGVIGFLLLMPVLGVLGRLWELLLKATGVDVSQQEMVQLLKGITNPLEISALVALVAGLAPVTEEVFFRGGLMRFLCHRVSWWQSIAISAALFALIHLTPLALLPLFLLGCALGLVYMRTRHIAAPIVMHACFNLTTVGLVLLEPHAAA